MVVKASGQEYKRKGEKRITFEEWLPIYEQLSKEKVEQGTFHDFMEGLKVFDKEECGKIMAAELRHILLALGERLNKDEVEEIMKGVEDAEGMVNYEGYFFHSLS
uniref:EF-hand domain-containing protein n=1 Tax=Parascaris equorum TaxID=6256 RepID=A0A914S4B6_PAREQ